jgi:hypothetical protein
MMAKPKGPTKKKATATEPFLLTPRGYKAWRDALEKQGRSPRGEFREAAVIIFRIVEWSALTGAVWAIGSWVGDQFILGAATFLFLVLAAYTTGYILSMVEGFENRLNQLLIATFVLVLAIVALNFAKKVVLYGGQQLQQLPRPKDTVPFQMPW